MSSPVYEFGPTKNEIKTSSIILFFSIMLPKIIECDFISLIFLSKICFIVSNDFFSRNSYYSNCTCSASSCNCTNCILITKILHNTKILKLLCFNSFNVLILRREKDMSVLVNKDSKVIIQGFTGSEGYFSFISND